MAQEDTITFEALPQRVGANKAKRRRKGDPPADNAGAAAAAAPSQAAATQAAAEAAPGAAQQAAAAVAGALSTGFGLHNIGKQQLGEHEQQQQPHVGGSQQYRSAAVGEHKFEYLDHTADVQLHAWGSSLREAFEQVGLAMVNYMTPIDGLRIDDSCTRQIQASGHDLHSLLFNWLDELLFAYATEYVMFGDITIDSFDIEGFSITATGRGEKFDRSRHECGTEVKAITYSAMQIREAEGDAEVFVIVDI